MNALLIEYQLTLFPRVVAALVVVVGLVVGATEAGDGLKETLMDDRNFL